MYHLPGCAPQVAGDCGGLDVAGEDSRQCLLLLDESGASRNPWSAMENSILAGDLGEALTFVRDPALPHDDGSKLFDGGSSRLSGLGDCSLMMAPDTQGDPHGPLILHSCSTRDGLQDSPFVTVTGAANASSSAAASKQVPATPLMTRIHEAKHAPTPSTATKPQGASRPGNHAERGHHASTSSSNAGSNRAAASSAVSAASAKAPRQQPAAVVPVARSAPPTASMWTQQENDTFFSGLERHRRDFERIFDDLKGSKTREQVRCYYYRVIKKLTQVIQPTGIEIEPSKNKEIVIDDVLRAVLAWYKMVKDKVQGRKLEATSLNIFKSSADVTHEQRLQVARCLTGNGKQGRATTSNDAAVHPSTSASQQQQQQRIAPSLNGIAAPQPTTSTSVRMAGAGAAAVGGGGAAAHRDSSRRETLSAPVAQTSKAATPMTAQTPLRDDRVKEERERAAGGSSSSLAGSIQSPDGAVMSPSSTACSPSNPQFTVNSSLGGARPDRLTLKLSPSTGALMEDISASSGNNPQLELSFKSAKSIGAIAAHLQDKWALKLSSKTGYGPIEFRIYGPSGPSEGWGSTDKGVLAREIFTGMGSPSEFKLRYYAHASSNPGALPQYQPPGGAYVSSPSSAAAYDEGIGGSSGGKQVPGTPSSAPSPRVGGGDHLQSGAGSAGAVESRHAPGMTDSLALKKHGSNIELGGVGGSSAVVVRSPPIADDGCGRHSEDSRGSVDKDAFVPFMAYKSASPQAQSSNRSNNNNNSNSNDSNSNDSNKKPAECKSSRAADGGRGVGAIGGGVCGGNVGGNVHAMQNPVAGHGEAAKEWQDVGMCSNKAWQESGGESRLEHSHHQMSVGDSNLGIDLGCYEEMGQPPTSIDVQRGGGGREGHHDVGVVQGEAIQDVWAEVPNGCLRMESALDGESGGLLMCASSRDGFGSLGPFAGGGSNWAGIAGGWSRGAGGISMSVHSPRREYEGCEGGGVAASPWGLASKRMSAGGLEEGPNKALRLV